MSGPYSYTHYIWPQIISIAFMLVLAFYSWRHRAVAGALPFAITCLIGSLWAAGNALELAAVDLQTRIFWVKFQGILPLCATTAIFCFNLEYAGLGRWLTRRTLILLSIPPLLFLALILTNELYQLVWLSFFFDRGVHAQYGSWYWIILGYGYLLSLVGIAILIRLFIRSPQQRWPVGLILFVQLVVRVAFLLNDTPANPVAPMDLDILIILFASILYAIVLFRFRIFNPIPVARATVIEQMRGGMLVLDKQRKIVDLNPAAEKILGTSAERLKGRLIEEVLPECPDLSEPLTGQEMALFEISLPGVLRDDVGSASAVKDYALRLSPLKDRYGNELGDLILLHDISEQKRAQTQLLEHQRVVATLQERERLARELHDNAGQVLGYVSMQAQAIAKWLRDGETAHAETQLARLADVAQEAHIDLRESILNLKAGQALEWSFLSALQQHLDSYQYIYNIRTELSIPASLGEEAFGPEEGVQLLRVIQEALTNARKHGRARRVQVSFEQQDGRTRIVVADDGCGFDLSQLADSTTDHFGLAFMRERMAQIGGSLAIESQPGAGTQIVLQAPIRDRQM